MSISVFIAITQIIRLRYCLFKCTDRHDIAIAAAAMFLSLTIPISVAHSLEHLTYFVKPNMQKHIVRIIWIVPIFALKSFLSLVFIEYSFYFQAIREIYEAYVIYCFMRYLLNCLGDKAGSSLLADRLATMPSALGIHRHPFCFLPAWQMGEEFLRRCKIGVFQYVIVRVVSTSVTVLLYSIGCYDIYDDSLYSIVTLIVLVNSVSQTWALYSLMLFYQVKAQDYSLMQFT